MRNYIVAFVLGLVITLGSYVIADQLSLRKVTNPRKATDIIVVYGNSVNGADPNGAGINWSELTRQVAAGINWQAINTTTGSVNWDTFPNSNQP